MELVEEYIDLLETDYFQSTLHDLLDVSYQQVIKEYLMRTLTTPVLTEHKDQSLENAITEEHLFKSPEDRQPMIKIITQIFVIQQSEVFLEQLKIFNFPDVQAQLDLLIKLTYF